MDIIALERAPMDSIRSRAKVAADGRLTLELPPSFKDAEVDVVVSRSLRTGAHGRLSDEDFRRAMRETAGSIPNMQDVERPGPEGYDRRESWT